MNNKFFDITDLEKEISRSNQEQDTASGSMAMKFLAIHDSRVESIKHLTGRIPGDDEILFLWTVNSFNAFTFIPFLIKECGSIEELILATYSINIRIIDALVKLIDRGMIHQVDIFISDSIRTRLPKVNDHLQALVGNRAVIRVHYAWTHAKISLVRIGDWYFVVEGSGNWSENAQHEQYIFLNSKRVFEFRKNEILYGIDRESN
ncbi:MAG: hypothetical protein D4R67_11955 [Bacteroidetes bacterium]|nr:MAG: hypothetical protein D4R67_11955 [Bacteroidota bacterium]